MIESVSHITLIAKDVERMAEFLRIIFDAEEVYDSKEKNYSLSYEKFFLIGGTWVVVMEGEPLPKRSYNHIAFKVPEPEFDEYAARIKKLGIEIKQGRERALGEARSIYFYDYDNHLFEIHSGTLEDRLDAYRRLGRVCRI